MAHPVPLPNEVLAGLGLAPTPPPAPIPPFDDSLAGAPPPLPEVPQYAAPVGPPPLPTPLPTPGPGLPQLPSLAGREETSPEPTRPDFQVPVSDFGQQQPPAPQTPQQARPRAPMSPDQQLQGAAERRRQSDIEGAQAIGDETAAKTQLARDNLAAHDAYKADAARVADQQKAFADDSAKIRAQKLAYVDSVSRDAESYRVDRNKFVNDMKIGKMAGWGIAMILSGIGDALQGKKGVNPVVQMFEDQIQNSINAQLDERDRLKERRADARHELDRYDQFSKDRNAQFHLMMGDAQKKLALMLDSAAAKAAEPLAAANGRKAAAELLAKSGENMQKAAEFASTNDISKRQLQVSQGNLAVSQQNAAETNRHNLATEDNARMQRELEAAKLEKQGKVDQAKLLRERGFGGEAKLVEVDPKDVKAGEKTIVKDGKTFISSVGPITMRNGDPFIPIGTEPVITEAQKKYGAQERLRGIVNRMLELGPEYLSATVNSDQYQQMKQEFDNARLEVLQFKGMGAPQSKDMEYAAGFIGTPDPTRWKDSVAGLKEGLKAMERDQAATFRALGLDKEWKAPNESAPGSKPSQTEQLTVTLKAKPDENRERAWQKAYASELKATNGDVAAAQRAANTAMSEAGAVGFDQRPAIKTLTQQAIAGDTAATEALVDVSKTAQSPTVRRLAEQALSEIRAAQQPQPTTSSAGPVNEGYNPADLIRRFQQPPPSVPTVSPRTRSASIQ